MATLMEPGVDANTIAKAYSREISLRDGTRLCLRPVLPSDKQMIAHGLTLLSPESRYRRFMAPVDHLSDERLRYLTEIDYDSHFAWAAFAIEEEGAPGVAVGRYVRHPDAREIAEPAVAVLDDYQGRGLGTILLNLLAETAAEHGIERFRASLLADNEAMRELLKQAGATFKSEGYGVLTADVELPHKDPIRWTLLRGMIAHACSAGIDRARDVFHGSLVLKDPR